MKKLILTIITLFSFITIYSQDYNMNDTIVDGIDANWVNEDTIQVAAMELQEIVAPWVAPEPEPKVEIDETKLTETDLQNIQKDVQFLSDLPKSYGELPKENLKNLLVEIDNKINQLTHERDSLLAQSIINEELVKSKESTISALGKEKNIIGLTLETGSLYDANGNLRIETEALKKYLYWALGGLGVLGLVLLVFLQRKRIQVQDVEIEEQLNDIAKKNSYLEHAARIIRHDMHSGINTYMPRGISSLEKRLTTEDIQKLKIEAPLKMVKEGLAHTQKVYKSVYEFTNLVKQNVVLNKSLFNLKELVWNYISPNSYSVQVDVQEIGELEVNQTLFPSAIESLIKNGLTYNDSEVKKVEIYTEENYLIVEDNGRGFTQKQFEKQLKRFSKKTEFTEDEKGLGLNICYAILKEHGFELTFDKIETGTKAKIKIK